MRLFVLLAVYITAAAAGIVAPVVVRQTSNIGATGQANRALVSCSAYSSIANLSQISSNSTYRAAFLRSTTDGTNKAARILNAAQAQLPSLINDVPLNQQCGNATALAIAEVVTNFTNGIIAEFKIQPTIGVDATGGPGLITIMVVIMCCIMTCGVYTAF